MRLVILGAGASYDCIREEYPDFKGQPFRPPLANHLFQLTPQYRDLLANYPGARALRSELATVPDIETFFQDQWDFAERTGDVHTLACLINTQYYLQALLDKCSSEYSNAGASNYEVLVNHAHRYATSVQEDVMFVTFNYDTLLESAMRNMLFPGSTHMGFKDYISTRVKVIKPHGSCNWYRPLDPNFILPREKRRHSQVSYILNKNRRTLKEIEEKLRPEMIVLPGYGESFAMDGLPHDLYPMLLVPMRSKDAFVLPPEHVEAMRVHLQSTTEILIIGWKGQENAFNKLLKECIGERTINIRVVCGATGAEVGEALKRFLPNANVTPYTNAGRAGTSQRRILFEGGSFSAYTVEALRRPSVDFFALPPVPARVS